MITCCKDCVPPKRHGGCHSTCPEYIAQQIVHEAQREKDYQEKIARYGLSAETERGARAAKKRKRR